MTDEYEILAMIKESVGLGGHNRKGDVTLVQEMLNGYADSLYVLVQPFLTVDGKCGTCTIKAIKDFQASVVGMAMPDGRVDAGGRTSRELARFAPVEKNQSLPFLPPGWLYDPWQKKACSIAEKKPAAKGDIFATSKMPKPSLKSGSDPRKLTTRAAIAEAYGKISAEKVWARKAEFLKKFQVPEKITGHKDYKWVNVYDPKKRNVSNMWVHKAMHPFLTKAFDNISANSLVAELTEYGGSHCIRATRGTTDWSAHSWALAIDINMTGNGLGKTPTMSEKLVKCFTDAGFGWGGDYKRKDGMHFTIAGFDMPSK